MILPLDECRRILGPAAAGSESAPSGSHQEPAGEPQVGAHTVVTNTDENPVAVPPCTFCGAPIVPTRKLRKPRRPRLYCSEHCRYLAWRRRNLKPKRKPRKPRPSDQLRRLTVRVLDDEWGWLAETRERLGLASIQAAAAAALRTGLASLREP